MLSVATETVFDDGGMTEQIQHTPLGVVANISAWNYPWFVGCNVIVPALLTGNAVLYKPSEYATMTGLEIARLLHEAGVPRDVMVCLVGAGAVGAALAGTADGRRVLHRLRGHGQRIAQAVGNKFIKLQLELGGKDPTYVCEDADPKAAAESLADGAMYNTGQSCCSVERIYVHEKIHDAFVAAFVDTVKAFKAGDPMSEDTYIGAITRAPQLDVLDAQVADALAKGAHAAGRRPRAAAPAPATGTSPRCSANVNHSMELMKEESFGPIIGIQKVSGDEEAVKLMNDTRYGLTAGCLHARRGARAAIAGAGECGQRLLELLRPREPAPALERPRRFSGVGLTLSTYGIHTFTRPKAWHLMRVSDS
jgi:acyl-CoA reductase-like NAD-dependent aldehyde dehydrogenase